MEKTAPFDEGTDVTFEARSGFKDRDGKSMEGKTYKVDRTKHDHLGWWVGFKGNPTELYPAEVLVRVPPKS